MRKYALIIEILLLLSLLLTGCTPPHVNAQGLPSGDMIILDKDGDHAAQQEQIVVTLKPAPTVAPTATPVPTAAPSPVSTPVPTPEEPTPEILPSPDASGPENPAQVSPSDGEIKYAYLTFDDGPSENTEEILRVLNEKGVTATFFVVGDNAARHPERIRAIAEQGSLVANHTQTHNTDVIYKDLDALLKDLSDCRKTIHSILGPDYPDDLIRFPYGSTNRRCRDYREGVRSAGYRYFDWNALNGDAEHDASSRSSRDLYNKLVETVDVQAARGRDLILLMHDTNSKDKTVAMLGDAIDYIHSLGYTFATLENKPMD